MKQKKKGDVMDIQDVDFEEEFESNDEVEALLDELTLDVVEDIIEQREARTSIINPNQIQRVLKVYKLMKYLTKDSNAKVTYELHEPYKSMGSVSVIAKNYEFSKVSWFLSAVKLASNFEVYPKTDSTICMTFTFHNLTMPME